MMIGAWLPYTAYKIVGAMDQFQIFNHCLTEQEIREMYRQVNQQ